MERQYLRDLIRQSRECECPNLVPLFKRKQTASERERVCSYLSSQVDLESLTPQDKNFLESLMQARRDFQASVHRYNREIRDLSSQGKITFFVHDGKNRVRQEVNYSDAYINSQREDLIVTAHCSRCDNQFDVLSKE
jgi:hypothetical protein